MSVQASTWAWNQKPGAAKLLLMALSDAADPSGICWPGQKHLASKCDCSVRAIRDNLTRLEEAKLILRVPQFRTDGSRTSDVYVLAPDGDRTPMEKIDRQHQLWPRIREAWMEATGDLGGEVPRDLPPADVAEGEPAEPAAPPASARRTTGDALPGIEPSEEPSEEQEEGGSAHADERMVLGILQKVAREKPCPRVPPDSLRVILDAFPDAPHLTTAQELEFWALHGTGKARQIKNLTSTYRTFLKRADDDRRARPPESSVQSMGRTSEKAAKYDSHVRRD